MIRQKMPSEVASALEADPKAVYLDVRSQPEFAAGHPAGAYNVPLLHLDESTGRPEPNADFERVVAHVFSRTTPVIVGCQSGGRSQRAAEILAGLGFTDVTNMEGGFGGARDPGGEVAVPGWQDSGLSVETSARVGRSYEELQAL